MGKWSNSVLQNFQQQLNYLKTEAMDILESDYKNVCITIYHAKWNEELKKRLSALWKGIIGDGNDKNCNYHSF